MRNKLGAAVVIAVLTMTGACGSSAGGRPSEGEISKALQKGHDSELNIPKLDQKSADCLAKVLEDSKLSDKALRALVKEDKNFKGSNQDEKALAGLASKAGKCAPSK